MDIIQINILKVEGDILVGKNLTKFVPNPTIEATKHIAMDVLFTNIEVEGDVIVKNVFNSTTIQHWLEDVVYKVLAINRECFAGKRYHLWK